MFCDCAGSFKGNRELSLAKSRRSVGDGSASGVIEWKSWMKLVFERVSAPVLSFVLIDWGVRESFHTLKYLADQTAPRERYEVIWLEFYEHMPAALDRMLQTEAEQGR